MLSQVYEPLIGWLLPELCQRCGTPTRAGFCAACRAAFVPNDAACPRCGTSHAGHGALCPAAHKDWRLAGVIAPLCYAPPLDRYLHALKYGGERRLGRSLGQLLAVAAAHNSSDIDALVSVPLHPHRLVQRGYNQSLEIARTVSAALRIPVLRSGIRRHRETPPQALLDRDSRMRNLDGAFTVSRALGGMQVALIDDVMTTGATANALAAALLRAGACRVEAWVVARTHVS